MLVIAYLILQADLEGDSVREDEERKLFVEILPDQSQGLTGQLEEPRLSGNIKSRLGSCKEHFLDL